MRRFLRGTNRVDPSAYLPIGRSGAGALESLVLALVLVLVAVLGSGLDLEALDLDLVVVLGSGLDLEALGLEETVA